MHPDGRRLGSFLAAPDVRLTNAQAQDFERKPRRAALRAAILKGGDW